MTCTRVLCNIPTINKSAQINQSCGLFLCLKFLCVAQLGRVVALDASGRWFESIHRDQNTITMNLERLINQLKSDEGFRTHPYKDTLGIWTIGYGCTSIDGVRVTELTKPINKYKAEQQMFFHLHSAWHIAKRFVNNWYSLSSIKQEAIVNMAYQMGNKIKQFIDSKAAIEAENWVLAHKELLNSKWARQTPARAQRVAGTFLQ